MADAEAAIPDGAPLDARLGGVAEAARQAGPRGPAPVHLWNPPFCGDIGLAIARDGTWSYRGSPITRQPLVRLFASVLRRDPEGHMLVTPVEKIAVAVEDAPFLAVDLAVEGEGRQRALRFRTNLDDEVVADGEHPITFVLAADGGLKPYIDVRRGLLALVTRALVEPLVDLGETQTHDGVETFGIMSRGVFFPIAPAATLDGAA